MTVEREINGEQSQMWNGPSGRAWVDMQALLDGVFKPLGDMLVAEAAKRPIAQVLDIGCGTGATTLAVARALRTGGHCIGLDISEPMLAVARARAGREKSTAEFLRADAQTHPFEPARFDLLLSRFGVMFFEDSVQAFSNLRRASQHSADMRFLVWRSPADNPFMTTAERAAAPLLPTMPARDPDAPGQFAFADRQRVTRILEQSGWGSIDISPVDVPCRFPEQALSSYFMQLGPLARILQDADEQTRTRIVANVRAAFDPYVHGDEVRFDAACWMIGARNG